LRVGLSNSITHSPCRSSATARATPEATRSFDDPGPLARDTAVNERDGFATAILGRWQAALRNHADGCGPTLRVVMRRSIVDDNPLAN
jgi:hypothetical protein